jgi:hypothetical protein
MNSTLEFKKEIKDFKEEIKKEKRRRNQVYVTLNYFLANSTYFDFFSIDAFEIVTFSQYIGTLYNISPISSDLLLLSFFFSKNNSTLLLEEANVSLETIMLELKDKKPILFSPFSFIIKQWSRFKMKFLKVERCQFAKSVYTIFEKTTKNSVIRLKTPVITSTVLLITMMEQEDFFAFSILKKALETDLNWHLLRYKLIKHIHYEELHLRNEVLKNQHYFAYLFKTQLTEQEFDFLIKKDALSQAVPFFRNIFVSSILKQKMFKVLTRNVKKLLKLINNRTYVSLV